MVTAFSRYNPDAVWLNPVPPARWMSTPSIRMTYQLLEGRVSLTVDGLMPQ